MNPESGHKPYSGVTGFDQLPLSTKTLRALRESDYHDMTRIQRAAIPHALCGRDVLGAAKTGSGKTLAFLIPVVEKLYRLRWGSGQGLAALIISPTRELARQIFQVVRQLLKYHDLSTGLLIGGTDDANLEKKFVGTLSILVATPGRLLHHLHQTANLDCNYLQILVLDEADRILDEGFAREMSHILAALPKERQTLLFSATQTRSVADLARLSLQDPEYLSVHAAAAPSTLRQRVVIVPLHLKIQALWHFIKTHLNSKILVFLSTCTQVKFVCKAFSALRPGIPLACLHGRLNQKARDGVFEKFKESRASVLFATDIAARGLDFPCVDWVVQVDCPEDVKTYLHRAGRSARNGKTGSSVLFLDPSEAKMIPLLEKPIHKAAARMTGDDQISQRIAALLTKDPALKHSAQRACITYIRSIFMQKNKEVFDVRKLPVTEFALSMGLPSAPRIRILDGVADKNQPRTLLARCSEVAAEKVEPTIEDDEDELIQPKKKREGEKLEPEPKNMNAQKKPRRLRIDPGKGMGQRLVFNDEDGGGAEAGKEVDEYGEVRERYKRLRQEMEQRDAEDKIRERQRLKEMRLKTKEQLVLDSEHESGTDAEDEAEMGLDSLSLAKQEALARKLLAR